jgi:hypothetical protein
MRLRGMASSQGLVSLQSEDLTLCAQPVSQIHGVLQSWPCPFPLPHEAPPPYPQPQWATLSPQHSFNMFCPSSRIPSMIYMYLGQNQGPYPIGTSPL